MPPFYVLLTAIALPLFLTAGAIAAIHFSRQAERRQAETWRDTSLDDWRSERQSAIDSQREQRAAATEQALTEGTGEESAQPVQQQRLGG